MPAPYPLGRGSSPAPVRPAAASHSSGPVWRIENILPLGPGRGAVKVDARVEKGGPAGSLIAPHGFLPCARTGPSGPDRASDVCSGRLCLPRMARYDRAMDDDDFARGLLYREAYGLARAEIDA